MKFRKKPVVIEAQRFDGTESEATRLRDWIGAGAKWWRRFPLGCEPRIDLDIPTLEGTMRAEAGDWIIKGIKGEFYPCKPEIFAATYDAVAEQETTSV